MPDHAIIDLDLPNPLRLDALVEGPASGWLWNADADRLRVAAAGGPLQVIEPVAVAMLGAWAAHQRLEGRRIELGPGMQTPAAYKAGLLTALAGSETKFTGEPSAHQRRVWMRLATESEAEPETGLVREAVEALEIPRHDPTFTTLAHCAEDLARNVFHHAASRGGAHVAASFDIKSRLVRLGVADCGRGIAADMRPNYPSVSDDEDLVRMALEPNVSGRSAQKALNRGVGLYVVRRLALAGRGAFWVRTGAVRVDATSSTPESFDPRVDSSGTAWQGTAVAVTFRGDAVGDFQGAIRIIRDAIEGKGPSYGVVQFYKRAVESEGWGRVAIEPDTATIALDRNRAHQCAHERLQPLLAAGRNAILDFSGVKTASQAFCWALLSETFAEHGPPLIDRIRFIACSPQVQPLIRSTINAALQGWSTPESPPDDLASR